MVACFVVVIVVETGSHYVALAGLELTDLRLSDLPVFAP